MSTKIEQLRSFTQELVGKSKDLIIKVREIMKKSKIRIPDQLIRLMLVFAILIFAIWFIRTFVIPSELKETGIHRTFAIKNELAKEFHYVGSTACGECHDEQFDLVVEGNHEGLSCELCHGPGSDHIEDPSEFSPDAPRDRQFCPVCHNYNLSRPTGFAQINPVAHNPLKACIVCHDPHDPKPVGVPKECSACHEQIVRTKAVSPHVLLECTTCHDTTDEHKLNPRDVKPTKPTTRDFCAQCHSKNSEVRETPKIDFVMHHEKYVCWQCHYPHMPEIQ